MNKIALKQAHAKAQPPKTKKKQIVKKVCKCAPTRTCKKGTQSKVAVRQQTKIKKVINNIRSMCGDGKQENSIKDLNNKSSNQSVIYVGTYPKQSCPTIDLTMSNTSLEESRENHDEMKENHLRTFYVSSFANNGIRCLVRPTKPTSLMNLPLTTRRKIVGHKYLHFSNSSTLFSENRYSLCNKIAALDLPEHYREEMFRDYFAERRVQLDNYDRETMDMILDLEDEYQFFIKGKFQPHTFFNSNIDTGELITRYISEGRDN